MNFRSIASITALLYFSMCTAFSQTLDLQFLTEIDCDNELYHVTIQTKVTQTGQEANLGNSSVLFEYNASALEYLSYESLHFDGSDNCIGIVSAWGVHGIDGVSDGIFNLTINLEVPLKEDQGFASCPTITDEWVDMATITFSIENMNSTSNLFFSNNEEFISFNNFYPNDGSAQLQSGIFYDLDEPFLCGELVAPIAAIQSDVSSGDAALDVNFDASNSSDSDGTIESWEWSFGDGSTGLGESVSHTYTDPGTYTVVLIVIDNDGLTHSDETTITVNESIVLSPPIAEIFTDMSSGSTPLTINFSGLGSSDSDGTITNYAWNFGDGNTGAGVSATHTYNSEGIYTATLIVTDNDGLTDETSVTITVDAALEAPIANITTDTNSGNAPLPISFSGSSSTDADGTISNYSWNFGDGNTGTGVNISHTFVNAGSYTVTLTVTDNDGLTDSSVTTIVAGEELVAPVAIITTNTNSGDIPANISFNGDNSSDEDGSIVTYLWDFGDGNTESGSANTHTYTTVGTYTVTLTVTDDDGLTDETTTTITITNNQEAPVAIIDASANSGNAPFPVIFDGSGSSDADGSIVTYDWDYGDGDSGSGITSNHIYSVPGTYTVTLTVTDDDGLTNSTMTTMFIDAVLEAPTADIASNVNSGTAPLTVNFDGSNSSDNDGTIVTYSWAFGDGSTGTGISTNHMYTTSGAFTVTLTVTDNDGLSDETTRTITVDVALEAPVADISSDENSGTAPLTVNFDGSGSNDNDGTINLYSWDFGDGNTGTGITTSHTYTSSGTYTVTLIVTDNDGLTDETTKTIIVEAPLEAPTANISSDENSGTAPLAVNFDGSGSNDNDGTIVTYSWDFGDGNTDSGITTNHTFTTSGIYTVTLTVTDNDGLSDETTRTITVDVALEAPTADISSDINSGIAPLTVSFDGSGSNDNDGSIVGYAWDFGDGNTGNGVTTNHTYTTSGTYTVTLTVTDNDGLTDETSITITVEEVALEAPIAVITSDENTGTAPLTVSFDGSESSDSDGTISLYSWDFGDGTMASGINGSHTYVNPGNYTVTLTVTDNDGLTGVDSETIVVTEAVVLEGPEAIFTTTITTGDAPLAVGFDAANSTDSDGAIVSYDWDFGDMNSGTGVSPNHMYLIPGTYTVTLTVTDNDGLKDSATETIVITEEVVLEAPVAEITMDTDSGEAPLIVSFDGSASNDSDGAIVSYDWDFGNGETASGVNVGETFNEAGEYDITLTVTDNDGLSDSKVVTLIVTEAVVLENPIAEIKMDNNTGEAPLIVNFDGSSSTDSDGEIVSYDWDFGNGETASGVNVGETFGEAGEYDITLTVTDNDGLTDSKVVTLVVTAAIVLEPPVAKITMDNTTGEAPLIVSFDGNESTDSDGEIVSYDWDFGNGETANGINVGETFSEAGEYDITLTVTDNDGLTDSKLVTLVVTEAVVLEAPIAEIAMDNDSGEAPLTVSFDGSASTDSDGEIVSYDWDFGDGKTESGINVENTFEEAGEYTVSLTVTDNDGLTDAKEVTLVVTDAVVLEAPVAAITTENTSGEAPFVASFDGSASTDSDGEIVSYDWDFGNGIVGTGINVSHVFTEIGTYDVTLTVTDNDGLTDSEVVILVVAEAVALEAPVAEITMDNDSGDAPLTVNFDGSASTDSDGEIVSYDWDFGDGKTGSGVNVENTFDEAGEYNITLTVTDNDGLTNSKVATLVVSAAVVLEAPIAEISMDNASGEAPLTISFDGSGSTDSDGEIVSYEWDFGNGDVETGIYAEYVFTEAGTLTVTLTVTDNDDLSNSTTAEIVIVEAVVDELPIAEIVVSGPTNLPSGEYEYELNGVGSHDPDGGDLTYEWKVDGETYDTDEITILILGAGTSSEIELVVTDDEGNTASDLATITTDCEIEINEIYEEYNTMICSGDEVNIKNLFAENIPENYALIDQTGETVLETDMFSYSNTTCEIANFIFTINYSEENESACTITNYNYTYTISVHPNLSGQIEYLENCVVTLNTCEQYEVTWTDGVNAGSGVNYNGNLSEGVLTFSITSSEAPEACSSTDVNAEINCVIPCSGTNNNICVDAGSTVELCPEFCDLPDENYIIVSAHTQYNCSLQLLGNNCINFTPVQGLVGISEVEIVACMQITSNEILCDTVYYNVAIGDCSQAPSQNATIDEANENCELEDLELCVAPYETEEICFDYCGVTKVIVDIKSSLNSVIGIENTNCINYIPNPFYESGTDTVEVFICDLDVNCQTVTIIIDVDPTCSTSSESRVDPDCEQIFSNTLTPNGDGRNDVWNVKNPNICLPEYNDMKLTILNKFGAVVHESLDGELPHWDGNLRRGQQADEGVYYYILQLYTDDELESFTGYIELRY